MDLVLTMHEQKYISGFKWQLFQNICFVPQIKQTETAKHPRSQTHNKNSVIKMSLIHMREKCITGTC